MERKFKTGDKVIFTIGGGKKYKGLFCEEDKEGLFNVYCYTDKEIINLDIEDDDTIELDTKLNGVLE